MRDKQVKEKAILRIQSLYRGGTERSIVNEMKAADFIQCNVIRFVKFKASDGSCLGSDSRDEATSLLKRTLVVRRTSQ